MVKLNYDVTRRSEAARRSNRRAEARLAKQFNDAGGLEAEMRSNLSDLKREQLQLRKELANLKFQARKSAEAVSRQHGVIHHAEPNMSVSPRHEHDFMHEVSHHLCGLPKKSEYGKNFFGYHSAPGSNKTHNRTVKDIEASLDNYFYKVEDFENEEKTKKKLKIQRKENKNVEVKVSRWKQKNPSRKKLSIRDPPNLHHLATLKEELMHKDIEKQSSETEKFPETSKVSRSNSTAESLPPINKNKIIDLQNTYENESKKSGESEQDKSDQKEAIEESVPLLRVTNNDDVFNAELYAPDGRLRMAHRLPEFQEAFAQAGNARYVRTRQKRDFERQMSNSQIFVK